MNFIKINTFNALPCSTHYFAHLWVSKADQLRELLIGFSPKVNGHFRFIFTHPVCSLRSPHLHFYEPRALRLINFLLCLCPSTFLCWRICPRKTGRMCPRGGDCTEAVDPRGNCASGYWRICISKDVIHALHGVCCTFGGLYNSAFVFDVFNISAGGTIIAS